MVGGPLRKDGLLERGGPFAAAMILALAIIPLAPVHAAQPLTAAAVLTAIIIAASVLVPWSRLPRGAQALPPLLYFVVIVFLREGGGGAASGYGPLVMLPILWLLLYGSRNELLVAIFFVANTFAQPLILFSDNPDYAGDWRRVVAWMIVVPLVAFTLRRLLFQTRQRLAAGYEVERTRLAGEVEQEVEQPLSRLLAQLSAARTGSPSVASDELERAQATLTASLRAAGRIADELRTPIADGSLDAASSDDGRGPAAGDRPDRLHEFRTQARAS